MLSQMTQDDLIEFIAGFPCFDTASNLNRDDVLRLNIAVAARTSRSCSATRPPRTQNITTTLTVNNAGPDAAGPTQAWLRCTPTQRSLSAAQRLCRRHFTGGPVGRAAVEAGSSHRRGPRCCA